MEKRYNLYNLEPSFKKYLLTENISPISLKNYMSDFRHFAGWVISKIKDQKSKIKNEELISINNISEYKFYLSENNIPHKTINRRLSTLRKFCSFCISQGWMKENPAKKILNLKSQISNGHPQGGRTDSLRVETKALKSPTNKIHVIASVSEAISKIKRSLRLRQAADPRDDRGGFGLQHYIGLIIVLIFIAALGAGIYNQFFLKSEKTFAFPTVPTRAGRILSFQGRLTDSLGNPITTATNVTFNLYNVGSGGVSLYTAGPCSTTPDSDGIFNTLIGGSGYSPTPPQSVCGTEITSNIFSENPDVYLGVTAASDAEMTPRQQIANVGYALNAETLQGLPPGTAASNIPYINSQGNLLIATANPGIRSQYASSTFTISSALATTIQSAGAGDVIIQATESGALKFRTAGVDDTVTRLIVANGGNVGIGDLTPASLFTIGNGDLFQVNSSGIISSIDGVAHTIDDVGGNLTLTSNSNTISLNDNVTFAGTTTLNNIAYTWPGVDGTDGYVLKTNGTGTLAWTAQTGGGGGGESLWTIGTGAIYPLNSTLDAFIGGTASSSAKFSFLNVNSGTPTASVSGTTANVSTFLTGEGNLATTNMAPLTLGGTTTGPIQLKPNNTTGLYVNNSGNVGIGTTNPTANLAITGITDNILLQLTNTALSGNEAFNLVGPAGTGAGKKAFSFTASGDSYANGMFYFDGSYAVGDGTATRDTFISRSAANTFRISSDGSTGLANLIVNGNVGIGTTGPDAKLDILSTAGEQLRLTYTDGSVYGGLTLNSNGDLVIDTTGDDIATSDRLTVGTTTPGLGKLNVVGAETGKALVIFDETGDQNILTASASGTTKFVITHDGNVGIGVTAPTNKLEIAGASSTISNDSGDITINSASNNISFAGDNLININNATISNYAYFAGGTTYYVDPSGNAKFLDLIAADTGNPGLTVGNGTTGFAKIGSATIGDNSTTYLGFDTDSNGTNDFQINDDGSITFRNNITSATTTTEGTVFYDSDSVGSAATDHLFLRGSDSAWHRVAMDMTKYASNSADIINTSYIEIAHNQNTNDLSLTGWVYDTISSLWKNISEYSHTIKHALQNEFDDASGKSFDVDTNGTLLNNLIAFWTLNETSATLTTAVSRYDSYGSNTLTDNPATTYTLSGTGKRNNAADFESGNSNFLEITDNGPLSTGDIDFTISSWVNIESTGANRMIATKSESASVAEYELYYNNTSSRFEFVTYNSSGTAVCTATANNLGAPSTATWYFITAWHDATANTCNIQVNNGTADSAAESGVPSDTAANFRVGARYTTEALFFDGLIDEVGFWKKTLSTQEKTDLYNSGNGNSYTTHGNIVRTQTALTSISLQPAVDVGTGADGAGSVSAAATITLDTQSIAGRSCADATNYNVTALTNTTATLSTTPTSGCLNAGDEILLINLQSASTSTTGNLGNYETLKIQSVSTNIITFTTAKTKYYGDNSTDDTNLGTTTGTQKVMLQRVPNYSSVSVAATGNLTTSAWNGSKGGVLFFRTTGTVTASGNIHTNSVGYRGGVGTQVAGEAFCGNPGGGNGGSYSANGGNGSCGGGGGGGGSTASFSLGGIGSSSFGGAGGGGGSAGDASVGYAGSGAGGGHTTTGLKGAGVNAGANGGTGTSGNGGNGANPTGGRGGGGGGGGTYGSADTTELELGSGGGAGGAYTTNSQGNGGNGGGITVISANTITISGTIASNGTNGFGSATTAGGCGGGGAGGSVKLSANTLTLGTNLASSSGGTGGSGNCTYTPGGNAGNGKVDIYYATSYSGSASSPTPTYTLSGYNTYGLYHSPVINTPNAATYESLRWETPVTPYGKVEFQTRSGATSSPTDGTWQSWKPFTASTNYVDLNTANTHTDWQNAYTLNVADGDTTRDIDQFEDEDEATAGNTTKLTATGFQTDIPATLTTSLISYWPMNETSAVAGTQVTRNDTYSTNHLTDNRVATSYILSGTGKISNAADLELANGNFFEKTDSAALSTGDIDFTVSAWVNMESESAGTTQETIISKSESATVREYSLYYTGATADRMQFELFDSGGTSRCTVTANTFGAVTTATWYYVMAWHDATANTCNISINNGTADSAAETGVPSDTAANLRMGATTTAEANFFDGLIDEVGFWKKTLSTQEKTDLYNSGNANTYPTNNQYAQASISSTDISGYDYLTAWVRASQTGSTIKVGLGESAATEQEETINIDAANTWQKVYWDLSDIQSAQRDAITKLRFTNLYSGANTISIDNVRAERLLTSGSHSAVTSTPNNYFQYRIIFSTTNTSYQPQVENIYLVYNDGYKIVQTDANTVRLYNYSNQTQNLRLDATVFGADLAEWYTVDDQSIGPGDLVATTGQLDENGVPILRKTNQANDPQIIGAISTKAGNTLGIEAPNRRLLALAGRIPVKIASDSADIAAGDQLTSASTPGYAKKAGPGNRTIGKAVENWGSSSEKSQILIIVGTSYQFPTIADLQNIVISQINNLGKTGYQLVSASQEIIENIAVYSEAVIANLKAGTIESQKIISPIAEIVTLNVSEKIRSPIVETTDLIASGTAQLNEIVTNEIKPQNKDLIIDLHPTNYPLPPNDKGALARLIIKGLEGKTVTTIDAEGNASFSGQLVADSLSINNNATVSGNLIAGSLQTNEASVSGKLIAGEIESSTINDIQKLLADIKTQPTSDPNNYQNLSDQQFNNITTNQLIVANNTNLYNVSVSNSLLVGTTLLDQNSIISLASELRLSALSTINLLDGAVIVARDGTITTRGEIIAEKGIRTNEIKSLTDDGQVLINNLAINNLAINDKYLDATTSAVIIAASDNFDKNGIFAPAIETATASAGIAILPENSSEIIIYNNYIKKDSLIYLTPTSSTTSIFQLTVGQKETTGKPYFKVITNTQSGLPVKFNWLIIN